MGKSSKTLRLREKIRSDVKRSKQTTLGNLLENLNEAPSKKAVPDRKKQIEITEIAPSIREDELCFKVGFRLMPSRTTFSKVTADLYFDEQKIDSMRLRVLQGPLAANDLEFSSVLDMTGIGEGPHRIRVEIYELWSSGEKLTCASKEVSVKYVPLKREDRLIKLPIVKSRAGADLAIVSESERNIYREIEENMKKEGITRRDEW